jgi:hypothetical protein
MTIEDLLGDRKVMATFYAGHIDDDPRGELIGRVLFHLDSFPWKRVPYVVQYEPVWVWRLRMDNTIEVSGWSGKRVRLISNTLSKYDLYPGAEGTVVLAVSNRENGLSLAMNWDNGSHVPVGEMLDVWEVIE